MLYFYYLNKYQSQNDEENSCDSSIKELDANGEEQTKFKVKYLHFNPKQHRRPPYYGTWRKKSAKIRPRAPFGKDDVTFFFVFYYMEKIKFCFKIKRLLRITKKA